MSEVLSTLANHWIFTGILCITVYSIVQVIAIQWRKARQFEAEAALKHEMVQRGMSAEEIRVVIRSSRERVKVKASEEVC